MTTEKTELRKRIESLAWRTGMMIAAVIVAQLSASLDLFNLPLWAVTLSGLVLGEVSKAINNSISAV